MPEESPSTLSRPVPAHDLPASGRAFRIEARPDERAALARHLGIESVEHLTADVLLLPEAAGRCVKLDGHLAARVVQTCVVTLDVLTADIDVRFERVFRLDADDEWEDAQGAGEVYLDLSAELPPEPLRGGIVDLGAAAAEQLALELDPYPRAPGAVFALPGEAERGDRVAGEDDERLVALARWRSRSSG